MNRVATAMAAATGLLLALPAHADRYVGLNSFYSTDADDTDIARVALDLDFVRSDDEHYQGLSLETARYRPFGGDRVEDQRLFYRFAGGDAWKWQGRVGSDGHSAIGSAAIHNESAYRQEYFVERDIVETPLGLENRLYSTFVGAAFDTPLGARDLLTTVVGVQDFGGDNLRTHYRGNLIHTLSEAHGLTAQLRVRAFRDSHADEADYFAPGWHAQAIPTLQWRRFVDGWRYQVAAGYGTQRDAGSSWKPAHLFEASVSTPANHDWTLKAGVLYTNTPGDSGAGYDYRHFMLTVGRTF